MRYIVLGKKIPQKEKHSRAKYIEKLTGLYFACRDINEGIEFSSIPSTSIDCLLLVGHNNHVENYLANNQIAENNIAIVSCKFNICKKKYKSKNIYVSYNKNGITYYYDGRDRGLEFNISEEETKLINTTGDLIKNIKKYFRRLL